MESIIKSALDSKTESKFEGEYEGIKIAVVGVGGSGNNTVNRLKRLGVKGAELIACNTDRQHLNIMEEGITKILIGKSVTKGLGAGGYPEVGAKCAEVDRPAIEKALEGAHLVFICAGMGGGTGTGAAPVIAEIAKKQGAITVAMVTYPFALERARLEKADWGLDALREKCDTVVMIDNNKLVQFVPNLPMNQAFAVADTLVARAVKGIADTVMLPSLMNIDFADLRMIMGNAGTSVISIGEGQGSGRVEQAVKSTLAHPLLEVDYAGAKGALILIHGGPQLSLGEAVKIGEGITEAFAPNAYVKWGARINPELGDKVIVTAVVTGITSPQVMGHAEASKPSQAQKVGLDAIVW